MEYQPPSRELNYEQALVGMRDMLVRRMQEMHRVDPNAPKVLRFYPIVLGKMERSRYLAFLYANAVEAQNDSVLAYVAADEESITFLDEVVSRLVGEGHGEIILEDTVEDAFQQKGLKAKITIVHKP